MYKYENEREKLFTDNGQKVFIAVRDNVQKLLKTSGAFSIDKAIQVKAGTVTSFELYACVDRLVELKEIKEVSGKKGGVFIGRYE